MGTARGFLGLLACVLLVSGCAGSGPGADGADVSGPADQSARAEEVYETVSCTSLLDSIVERERQEDPSGALTAEVQDLGDRCPSDYRVYVDYVSIKAFAHDGAGGTCSEYSNYDVEPAAIELARRDGFCSSSGSGSSAPAAAEWTCSYQPTFDYDWHNDVLCSNGTEEQRPYLREWDSYVTEDEIMESAREYEQQLNGAPTSGAPASTERGVVTRIVDGDTLDVAGYGRIRVIGIDTPERGECGFDSATLALAELVDGREVTLTSGAKGDRDGYGRLLRYVDAEGVDAGLRLIEDGWAIARYDSRDGYGHHTREETYVAADDLSEDLGCYE